VVARAVHSDDLGGVVTEKPRGPQVIGEIVTTFLQGVGDPAIEDHNPAPEELIEQRHSSSVLSVLHELIGDRR
jgi:hypothetical protein